jgi:multidrug efflux pump subunit AcrA (membrane-fusion protein)
MPEIPQETRHTQQPVKNKALDLSSLRDESDDLFEKKGRAKGSRRARRFWIPAISLVLLAAISVSVFFYIQQNSKPQVTYQYAAVTQGNFSLTVSATGPVQADTYKANFSGAGKISRIYIKLYDKVKKGQSLALLIKADGSTETLQAPHDGAVTAINNNVGDTLSPGAVAGSFIQITALSSLHIQANVNEADIGKVATGDQVQFGVSAYSSQTFGGKVTAVSPIGTTSSSVETYPVLVDVDMSTLQGSALLPNMTANVTITTISRTNEELISAKAIAFARQSLLQKLVTFNQVNTAMAQAQQLMSNLKNSGTKDPLTAAYVLERSNNQWVVKPVVVSLTDGSSYTVVAGTLKAGENLVIAIQNGSGSSGNQQLPSGPPAGGPPSGGPSGGGSSGLGGF